MSNVLLWSLTGAAWLLSGSLALADEPKEQPEPENITAAKAQLKEYLAKRGGESAQVLWLNDKSLSTHFPKAVFLAARFRQFPVARVTPEGLNASNVFMVADGKLTLVKDKDALQTLFKKEVQLKDKNDSAAAAAWLTLSQEYLQDGFFKFALDEKELRQELGDKITVTRKAIVMNGGSGFLEVAIHYKAGDSSIAKIEETVKVRPGPRPICHATKLLDADPLVRRIVEQDLLIMGLAAHDYLMEQRAQASPALRTAIDRLWERIVANGW